MDHVDRSCVDEKKIGGGSLWASALAGDRAELEGGEGIGSEEQQGTCRDYSQH